MQLAKGVYHMKKIIITILCIICLLSNVIVYASETTFEYYTEQKIDKLKEFNIINGYGDGNFYPEKSINRAEFCKMVSVISGINNDKYENKGWIFKDVPEEHWANKYIYYCFKYGYANGITQDGDIYFIELDKEDNPIEIVKSKYAKQSPVNMFEPDSYITCQDALKILVNALGYEELAKQRGDYPSGYVTVAMDIDIINSHFDNTDYISREGAAEIIYNALFTPLMTRHEIVDEYGPRVEYRVEDGKNGRDLNTLYKKYFEAK